MATATTAATIPGLVAAYGFNEGTGTTVTDSSGNGNNGTITNATWTTAGKYGDALSFNGTNAMVTIPNAASLDLTTGMTLEAWVNPSVVSNAWRDVIYKGNDNYMLSATDYASGVPAAGATLGSADVFTPGKSVLATSTWTFLTETYNGSALDLYVNGTLVSSLAQTGNIVTSTNPLQIGGDSIYGQFFQGLIDEVRVYNQALTQSQIQTDMNTPITPPQPPTAPTNLTASAVSTNQINLSWTASTANVPITGYLVYRENPGSSTFVQVGTTSGATTYSDTGLTASSTYNYEVQATDSAGNSPFSNVATATTQAAQPPTAPTNLTASAVSSSQIGLSWTASTANAPITGYLVYRENPGSTTFVQVGTTNGGTTSYTDSGLTTGSTYSYEVQATDSAGNSPFSNVATATPQATQGPTAPTNLIATGGAAQISLSWNASVDSKGVTGYLVYRENPGSNTFSEVGSATSTTYTDTGLAPSSTYSYEVQATDAAGILSPFSNVATAATTATIPGLVAAYTFNEGSGTTLHDSSGNGNNGTIVNATWTTAGNYGDALSFNGANAMVNIPNAASLDLTTGMTLEAWVNPSVVSNNYTDVIYKGNDNYILSATNYPDGVPAAGGTVGSSDVNANGTAALPTNTWSFLTSTYDGSDLRLYVNGTQVAVYGLIGSLVTSTDPLQIGGDSIYGQFFQGLIDQVRVYNVALTPLQIQSDMNRPVETGATMNTQPPTAPTNLTATASGNQVSLSWTASTDNVGVTGYLLYRENPGSSTFAQVGTATGTTFTDAALPRWAPTLMRSRPPTPPATSAPSPARPP